MQSRPFHQGQLDCLCGLYAIINATRLGMRKVCPFSDKAARALMAHLIDELDERGELARAMIEGLTIPELGQLLKVASGWLQSNFSIKAIYSKPFHCRTALTIRCVSSTIDNHLAVDGSSTLLMIRRPTKHWTVVADVSNLGLVLCDSEQDKGDMVQYSEARTGSARKRKTANIEIIPSSLFLLSFTR